MFVSLFSFEWSCGLKTLVLVGELCLLLGNVRIGFVTEKSNIFENKIVVSSLKIWDRESMAGRVFGWRAILVRSMTDFRTIMFCGIGLDIWPLSSVKHIIFLEELLIYVERLESYVSLTVFFFLFFPLGLGWFYAPRCMCLFCPFSFSVSTGPTSLLTRITYVKRRFFSDQKNKKRRCF